MATESKSVDDPTPEEADELAALATAELGKAMEMADKLFVAAQSDSLVSPAEKAVIRQQLLQDIEKRGAGGAVCRRAAAVCMRCERRRACAWPLPRDVQLAALRAEMTPFYERVCATLGWPTDEAFLKKLRCVDASCVWV
jgi:hypothetical protein